MNENNTRASREEIFQRLNQIVGEDAEEVISEAVKLYKLGQHEEGFRLLVDFDRKFGKGGIYHLYDTNRRYVGVYRAVYYVGLYLKSANAENLSRGIVTNICAHLENLLKHLAKLENFKIEILKRIGKRNPQRIHLGLLTKGSKKFLIKSTYDNLIWIDTFINGPAKHEFPIEDEVEEDKHFFEFDEALAIYFIGRVLGKELEKIAKEHNVELTWKISNTVEVDEE